MMTATEETLDLATATVAAIALRFPHAIDLLNQYRLDYCCNGKKNFADACRKKNLNPEKVWEEIQRTDSTRHEHRDRFQSWNLALLIDYIVLNHHQYVQDAIPEIKALLTKVCNVHGTEQPALFKIQEDFNNLSNELLAHLPKEEEILFPAIKNLEREQMLAHDPSQVSHLKMPISVMEHEHDVAGELIKSIRSLTDNYLPPAYACPTFQITYKMLQEFDEDLMQHIHLENNILFPKAQLLN